ncbi:glutamate-cysteine ligase family protein [Limibacter armeniacum]|uniref:glutamate-cysteine ligase family protein n=1 Tax=Limibacter armeniacum TaxID=466084 RepID=UPI002FE521D2
MANKKYSLFEVTGIELEYMVVDKSSLKVTPVVDQLFHNRVGSYVSDIECGDIDWSNELVAHVVELKTAQPVKSLNGLSQLFHQQVTDINKRLAPLQAQLMPTAVHPLMDPDSETQLWQHEYNEIYALYNRIFDCRGHGWSNLQSMHINLPFANDEEFGKLHAAIRVLLPIIPALSASSPILDGQYTGYKDTRMHAYLQNQLRIPILTGALVPEKVFDKASYHKQIFEPIIEAIKPFDTEGVTDHHFLNSRGAIARFDRGAIEIRVIDLQECPAADIAIAALIVESLKVMVEETWSNVIVQQSWDEQRLKELFLKVIKEGENAIIRDEAFLALFGIKAMALKASAIWMHLYDKVGSRLAPEMQEVLEHIFTKGSLATRISKAVGMQPDEARIKEVFNELATCLSENRIFG